MSDAVPRKTAAKKKAVSKGRARTRTILQLEAVECGAASLAMILDYYGRTEPLANLRQECGVSRDGSKASNVLAAARRYGMEVRGLTMSVEHLRERSFPCIVFWEFNHFLVVEGFRGDKVLLNDPAAGHRVVSEDDFSRSFTGVVLQMEPGPEFRPGGRRPNVLRAVLSRLRGGYAALAFCIAAGFLLVLPGLALPALTQVFIDNVLLEGRTEWVQPIIAAMMLGLALQVVLRSLQLLYLRRLRAMLSIRLASHFMKHLLGLPARFYAQRFAGEVAGRSRLNESLAADLSGTLVQTAIDVVMVGFYAAVMFYYDVTLTLIGIGFAILNVVLLRVISSRRVEANMKLLQERGKARGIAMTGLRGIETIKASGTESGFFGRWSGYTSKAANAEQNLEVSNLVLDVTPNLLSRLTTTFVLVLGGLRIIEGDLTIGMLIAFQALMTGFLGPIQGLLQLGGELQALRGDLDRVDDVLDHPTVDADAPELPRVDDADTGPLELAGRIELENISFGYSPLEPPLIHDFSLTIEPGERVALVGGSGSGKTTIARLITGEYDAWSGRILFDGEERSDIPREKMTRSLSKVDQEIQLFSGTVRDNLTLWDDSVVDDELERAAEDASIHDVVMALPGGYDSELLEGGSNLSGGQRQRLEIARALVGDPTILVMDEATSALDTETERLVLERLRMRGCSTVFVSHRLSTIRDCSEILVLDRGRIVERGSHDDLWRADGVYADLVRSAGVAPEGDVATEGSADA